MHMFWHCYRHKRVREDTMCKLRNIIDNARKKYGEDAAEHIRGILDNNTFQHTSICADDIAAMVQARQNAECDKAFNFVPEPEEIIYEDTADTTKCQIEDKEYIVVYTDGSTLNPGSVSLARSGWGGLRRRQPLSQQEREAVR